MTSPKVYKVKYFQGLGSFYAVGKPSDEREYSKTLHLQSYLEMLRSKTGYFGLLGKIIYCLLSYYILLEDKGLYGQNNGYGKIPLEQR